MTVVLDTNVIVAAAMSRGGASRRILELVERGAIPAAVSAALILEYEDVLLRQPGSLRWSADQVRLLLDVLCDRCLCVSPSFRFRPTLPDPKDEFVLECAFAASADYIITHNKKDFAGVESYGILAVTPGDFLGRFSELR